MKIAKVAGAFTAAMISVTAAHAASEIQSGCKGGDRDDRTAYIAYLSPKDGSPHTEDTMGKGLYIKGVTGEVVALLNSTRLFNGQILLNTNGQYDQRQIAQLMVLQPAILNMGRLCSRNSDDGHLRIDNCMIDLEKSPDLRRAINYPGVATEPGSSPVRADSVMDFIPPILRGRGCSPR